LETSIVVYTNQQGYKEFRKVPSGFPPTMYDQGIFLGPPALDSLKLTKKQKIKLNHALVSAGFSDYQNLAGKRYELIRIIRDDLKLDEAEILEMRNNILALYQKEAFPESFDSEE